jgi:hypothetical protein
VEEGSNPPRGDADVYVLRDEEAYLQTVEDGKPEIIVDPAGSRLVQVLVL